MAFNNLGLQEPSTVTARVATVTINRGSTTEHQEILVLGDPVTANAVGRVLAAPPASTEYGAAVRIISGPSSVADLAVRAVLSSSSADNPVAATQAGNWTVRATLSSTGADNPVSAAQSGAWAVRANLSSTGADNPVTVSGKVSVVNSSAADLNVTVAGYSTVMLVSSVQGIVTVRPSDTNWASSAGFHFNSSGELLTKDAGNSTIVTVSSVAGIVAVRPSDTNWASSAGFHFNSSGELLIAGGAAAGSTTVNVSSLAGNVRVVNSSAGDLQATVAPASTVWAVQAAQSGTWAIGTVTTVSSLAGIVAVRPSDTSWASSAGFHFDSSGALQISGTINASASTVTTVSAFYDSSNVAVQPGDAANKAIRVNVVAGTLVGGTGGTAATDQAAFTTNAGSMTPIGGYFSTTNSVVPEARVGVLRMSSVRALWTTPVDSTGGDLTDTTNRAIRMNVVAGGSTTVNVSSVAGTVSVAVVSGGSTTVNVSSLAGVVTVAPAAGSTFTIHIGPEHQSTAVAPSNSSAVNVRVVGGVSSAADFPVRPVFSSTHTDNPVTARNYDLLGNGIESSTRAVGGNSTMRGLSVRSLTPDSTFASGQAASSGDVTVFTSVTGQQIYVYALALGWGGAVTTNTNQLVKFQAGGSTAAALYTWRFQVGAAGQVNESGAVLAVTPPAYLFRTPASALLQFNATSSGLVYNVSGWRE